MAPILPSLELRPLFSRRLMRSTSMRGGSIDERSIRERERERAKRTILEISFPFSRSPVLPSFLVPRGKKEKSRQNHREETQFVEIGSNSRPRSSFVPLSLSLFLFHPFLSFSPAISIAITKSIYHDAHTARQKLLLNRTSPRSLVSGLFSIPLECDITILL